MWFLVDGIGHFEASAQKIFQLHLFQFVVNLAAVMLRYLLARTNLFDQKDLQPKIDVGTVPTVERSKITGKPCFNATVDGLYVGQTNKGGNGGQDMVRQHNLVGTDF